MKALSALRQVFSLKKNEELGRKFSPEELKRIVDAMKEYAASKLQEQRAICQREFELAYDSGESNLGTNPAITELYVLQSLKESETPELDWLWQRQTVIHVFGRCWRKCPVLTGTV